MTRSGFAWLLLLAALLVPAAHADTVESVIMPGQLIQGHADLEGDCKNCHVRFKKSAQNGLCLDCHKDVARDVTSKQGYHGRIPEQDCRACHTDHKGRSMKIAAFDEKTFDHSRTDFPLKGGHTAAKVQCRDCHAQGKKHREAPSECIACHLKDDTHKGSLGKECVNCHVERNWKEVRFDHSSTHFPLLGKHNTVVCKDCHPNSKLKGIPTQCVACHKKDDKHKAQYGTKCETCHTEKDWKVILFNHDKNTKFSLLGKHKTAKCSTCHTGILYQEKLATRCIGCHRKDDDHKGRFGEKCETCHTEKEWKVASFDHDRLTKYPLRGKHATAKCTTCHTGTAQTEKLKTECIACHRKDDTHKGRFGDKCETCHSEKGWKVTTFDHDRTKYPLRGKHATAKCISCHTGVPQQEKLKTDCLSCHVKDDKHNGQEGKRCESCHNERSWKETRFDHGLSRFPLLGKHANVDCKKCHQSPKFKDAKSDCVSCHSKDDKHKRRLGSDCATCHNTRDWKSWSFDHDRRTSFKLDGKHQGLDCLACHKKPSDRKISLPGTGSCASCHADEDVHNGGFGKECQRCHETSSFRKLRPGVLTTPRGKP